ncbi:cobalamin synthase [Calothrix sp. NIES-4071]|nr:cobalamin synthase [Calothrix sp. NIES-4071]BAZ59028.1 cobalamin synthase [Calothrix sp. NIES-4105]
MTTICQWCKDLLLSFISSIIFYTSISLPYIEGLDFREVARFAPAVGFLVGMLLFMADISLSWLGVPILTRSVVVVALWVLITGGLHLDGAMDTADGLAVTNPQRRLEVMADSVTGAFGATTAVLILLLKTAALSDIEQNRWFVIIAACCWGRWGQVLAILRYNYLKPTGKGAFHKEAIRVPLDLLPGLLLLLVISCFYALIYPQNLIFVPFTVLIGITLSVVTGAWFNYKLGGHTGDTYGAVVEWTEALFLCVMTVLK